MSATLRSRLVALFERADIVAAEDTRRLYDLARRLGVYVNGRVIAYHDHNERDKADGLLDQVETGATVLVVSDAGMPTINDLAWPSCAVPSNAVCPSPARLALRCARRARPLRPAHRPLLPRRLPTAKAFRARAVSAHAVARTPHHRVLRDAPSHC